MTFVIYNVYNEAANLNRAMNSAERHLDAAVHVVIDGKYPDYEGDSDTSTDGTRELAERRGFLLTVIAHECEKRSAGLRFVDEHAVDGDWVLVLDADEELTKMFSLPKRVGYIEFTRKTRVPVTYGRCRLYRWEPGLEFKHRHYDLYDRDGVLVSSLESAPDYQVVGHGNHYEKPRNKAKQDYYKRLRERESHPSEVPA